jgi:ferredoxin
MDSAVATVHSHALNLLVPAVLLAAGLLITTLIALIGRGRERARRSQSASHAEPALVHSINTDRCTSCGSCVAACPVDCLPMVGHAAQVVHPERCLQCKRCARACMSRALVMHPPGEEPPPVTLPEIDGSVQTRVPGQYLIGEVAGKPLVKHAANVAFEYSM